MGREEEDAAAAESAGAAPRAPSESALSARTPASRAEQREAVQQDVEARLSTWRRKRARAEAGLPEDDARDSGNNNKNNPERRRRSERSSVFPTAYYPEQAGGGGGGGGRTPTGAALPGGSRVTAGAWPDVYNAPVRRCLPGIGRRLLGPSSSSSSSALASAGGGSGGTRKNHGSEEARREAEERWEAPWMLGLVDRSSHGGGGGGGDGSVRITVDLVSSGGEEDQGEEGRNAGATTAAHGAGAVQSSDDAAAAGSEARHDNAGGFRGGSVGRGGWERGRGCGRPASADEGLSDLHHELLRFEEYVSLTPAEVRSLDVVELGSNWYFVVCKGFSLDNYPTVRFGLVTARGCRPHGDAPRRCCCCLLLYFACVVGGGFATVGGWGGSSTRSAVPCKGSVPSSA